jgi:hypothetical protein
MRTAHTTTSTKIPDYETFPIKGRTTSSDIFPDLFLRICNEPSWSASLDAAAPDDDAIDGNGNNENGDSSYAAAQDSSTGLCHFLEG